ncbi:MAG: M28 family peptidase [Thermoflexales bacterium]|nr:M28 family peptidase [Thermoflexales bacterium]
MKIKALLPKGLIVSVTLFLSSALLLSSALSACVATPPPSPPITFQTPSPRAEPISTRVPMTPVATLAPAPAGQTADPYRLISQESMFSLMQDLTAIQPHSGWRNSATEGEAEALDYLETKLGELEYLESLGLELERQSFRIFLSVEQWESRLQLELDGQKVQVPADGIRGHRDEIARALRFDSDGSLNDAVRNPVTAAGPIVLARSRADIQALGKLEGKIAFVDFDVISDVLLGKERAAQVISELLAQRPAGIVLVTEFSNVRGKSHGVFVADGSAFNLVDDPYAPPTLYVRLEDLTAAGIEGWDGLSRVEAAHLSWDADVFSPAPSGNLAARIPGLDPSRAVILGAHIDSPNNPGALDDGSGSVVLAEVARVLDAARVQPPVDTYLVWFGSEEAGLYGSSHFVATHQELADRTLAMLQVDMLSYPMDGIQARLELVTFPYTWWGDGRLTWPEYLSQAAGRLGIVTSPQENFGLESDNSAFVGFGVPNANLIYKNGEAMERLGSVHYACHIHDPYDTVELARQVGDVLEQMARVALAAALETGYDTPHLRVSPKPDRQALFVASHTEAVHMTPATFMALGATLEMYGFDVDMIPYGQPVTLAELENTDMVVALPVLDYPSPDGDPTLYDEAWTEPEIAALESYVAQGGFLVLANSARRLKYANVVLDPNEDWADGSALAERFGVSFQAGELASGKLWLERVSPLMKGIESLEWIPGNGVPFSFQAGIKKLVLAKSGDGTLAALVTVGDKGGQVLVLADVGVLNSGWGQPANLAFWKNLAWHVRTRLE